MNDETMFLRRASDGNLSADDTTDHADAVELSEGTLAGYHARILIPSMRPGGRIAVQLQHSRIKPGVAANGNDVAGAPWATMNEAEIAFATHVRPQFAATLDRLESTAVPDAAGEWGWGSAAGTVDDSTFATIAAGAWGHIHEHDADGNNIRDQLLNIKDDDYVGIMWGPYEWIVWQMAADAAFAAATDYARLNVAANANRVPTTQMGGSAWALRSTREQKVVFMHWPKLPAGHHHRVEAGVRMSAVEGWWRARLDLAPAGSYGAVSIPIGGMESAPQTLASTIGNPYPNWTRYGIPGPGQTASP